MDATPSIIEDWNDRPFEEMRQRFLGSQIRDLVQAQMRKLGDRLPVAILGTVSELTPEERTVVVELVDIQNHVAYGSQYWGKDLAWMFDAITDLYAVTCARDGIPVRRSAMFAAFNSIVLNLAYAAYLQPGLRVHAGVRRSFWRR